MNANITKICRFLVFLKYCSNFQPIHIVFISVWMWRMCNLIKCCWWHDKGTFCAQHTLDSVIYYKLLELCFQGCKLPRLIWSEIDEDWSNFLARDQFIWKLAWEGTVVDDYKSSHSFINKIGRDVYDEKLTSQQLSKHSQTSSKRNTRHS